jgi:phage terminase small subunit
MAALKKLTTIDRFIDSKKLTERQIRFCEEYITHLNAREAAVAAGYSPTSAKTRGHNLLRHPLVQELIQKKMHQRSIRTQITADSVLTSIQETIEKLEMDRLKNAAMIFKGNELLGKHLKLFTDRLEISGKLSLEALVAESTKDITHERG